jgi:hypothetical protein
MPRVLLPFAFREMEEPQHGRAGPIDFEGFGMCRAAAVSQPAISTADNERFGHTGPVDVEGFAARGPVSVDIVASSEARLDSEPCCACEPAKGERRRGVKLLRWIGRRCHEQGFYQKRRRAFRSRAPGTGGSSSFALELSSDPCNPRVPLVHENFARLRRTRRLSRKTA